MARLFRHAAFQPEAEYQHRQEACQGRCAIGVTPGGDRLHARVLQPFGQGGYKPSGEYDAQGVKRRAEAHYASTRRFNRVIVLDRGRHCCRCGHPDAEDDPEIHQVRHFGGPGVQAIRQAQKANAENNHRAASDAVGQHAERPDQEQAHDLGDQGEPAGNLADVRGGNSQMLDEDIGLGEVHVRHHPDANQGCVHVGPEVRYAHPGGQTDAPDAPTDALFAHGFSPWLPARHVIARAEDPGNEGFQPSEGRMPSFPGDALVPRGACILFNTWRARRRGRGLPALGGQDALLPRSLQKGALWTSLEVGKPARQSPAVTGFPVRREESPGSGGRDAR